MLNLCSYRGRCFLIALARDESKDDHLVTVRFEKPVLEDGEMEVGGRVKQGKELDEIILQPEQQPISS